MAVFRINKTADYTVISNNHFKEREMSLKAKGLLSLMLSLPDTWDYSVSGLAVLSKDGKDSVMNALAELEEFGYLKRTKVVDKAGRFAGYDYDIFEKPQPEKPYPENPNTDSPNTGNPPQLNTNQSNTDESITDSIKDIVAYLNLKLGTAYKASSQATQKHIRARLAEGFKTEDFRTVIDKKCAEWMNDPKMEKYLRPETLFGTKFEGYLNSKTRRNPSGQNSGNSSEAPRKYGKYI